MYSQKQLIQLDAKNIQMPTCMYQVQPLVDPEIKESLNIEENDTLNELLKLEQRQINVLNKLLSLKNEVENLMKSNAPGNVYQEIQEIPDIKINHSYVQQLEKTNSLDIVIYANPIQPPYSLLILHNLLSKAFPIALRNFIHSSCKTRNLPTLFKAHNPPNPKLTLTFIWMNLESHPQMVCNPIHCTKISGEVNIARFFARLFSAQIYEDLKPHQVIEIDELATLIHIMLSHGNNKDYQVFIKKLDSRLEKGSFLVTGATQPTLADILAYTSLLTSRKNGDFSKNITNWINALKSNPLFEIVSGL